MKLRRPDFAYIGKKPCGCVVALTLDFGDKPTAQAVKEFIEDGLTIERVKFGTPEYNEMVDNLGCKCGKQEELF
jgi:hypothetical protein